MSAHAEADHGHDKHDAGHAPAAKEHADAYAAKQESSKWTKRFGKILGITAGVATGIGALLWSMA